MQSPPSPFWRLPAEIRNEVYALAYKREGVVDVKVTKALWTQYGRRMTSPTSAVGPFLVSKQFYAEAVSIFASVNTFSFGTVSRLRRFATGAAAENVRRNISSVVWDTTSVALWRTTKHNALELLSENMISIANGLCDLRHLQISVDMGKLDYYIECNYEPSESWIRTLQRKTRNEDDFSHIPGAKGLREIDSRVRFNLSTSGPRYYLPYDESLFIAWRRTERAFERYLNVEHGKYLRWVEWDYGVEGLIASDD